MRFLLSQSQVQPFAKFYSFIDCMYIACNIEFFIVARDLKRMLLWMFGGLEVLMVTSQQRIMLCQTVCFIANYYYLQ